MNMYTDVYYTSEEVIVKQMLFRQPHNISISLNELIDTKRRGLPARPGPEARVPGQLGRLGASPGRPALPPGIYKHIETYRYAYLSLSKSSFKHIDKLE